MNILRLCRAVAERAIEEFKKSAFSKADVDIVS